MPNLADFSNTLQERLGVDSSYVSSNDIPNSVGRYIRKLLRDYNFPKSIRRQLYTTIAEGDQSYTLPDDCKRELGVLFYDDSEDVYVYSDPLRKTDGFVLPDSDGTPRNYWIEGTTLWTDIQAPEDSADLNLVVVYQSNDPEYNETWMLNDFEDVLFNLSMFRLSVELGKTELAQVYATLWAEDQKALAIYLNELEYGNMEIIMRHLPAKYQERYPASS